MPQSAILNNIWIINLKRSKDRLEHVTQYMNKYNLKFNVFEGIDGRELSDKEIEDSTTLICRTIKCNKSMVGCSKSHKGVWRQLLNDTNTDYYLIFEDDVVINQKFVDMFPEIENKIREHNVDFLSFYCSGTVGCGITPEFEVNDVKFGPAMFPVSLPAYIISKNGAKKLLDGGGEKMQDGVDFEIALFAMFNNMKLYLSETNIAGRNDDLQSTIKTGSNKFKPIVLNVLSSLNIGTLAWDLSYPLMYFNMKNEVSWYLFIVVILIVLNYFYIKNDIFGLFIFIELLLILS